jgi:hypothetical protein
MAHSDVTNKQYVAEADSPAPIMKPAFRQDPEQFSPPSTLLNPTPVK